MSNAQFGSPSWLEGVFASEPARTVKGGRAAQRFITGCHISGTQVAEGGNAATARRVLEILLNWAIVRRFKLEPFRFNDESRGIQSYVPDLIFQLHDQRTFVVETKSWRFLTQPRIEHLYAVQDAVLNSGLSFVLWTDAWPLTPIVYKQSVEMRRLGNSKVPEEKISRLLEFIKSHPATFLELRENGVYRDEIMSAAWKGQVFVNFLEPITDDTKVCAYCDVTDVSLLLNCPVGAQTFWFNLTRP